MVKVPYVQLGEYFDTRTGDNLACKHCGEIIVNADTIRHYRMMDELREWYGRSMPVNSGHRCQEYNDTLEGSAEKSRHIPGDATDWGLPEEFKGFTKARKREFLLNIRKKWFEICDKYGVAGGCGFYNTFVHTDSRPKTPDIKRSQWDFSDYFK